LIARAREQFERQFARKDAEFSKRESSIRKMRDALATIDAEIDRKLRSERTSIAKSEAKKVRRALAGDLTERDRRLANCSAT
jgi:hypothetical protein